MKYHQLKLAGKLARSNIINITIKEGRRGLTSIEYWMDVAAQGQKNEQQINYNDIYPTPPLGQDMTQGQFLSRV